LHAHSGNGEGGSSVEPYSGLVLKASYCRWPDQNVAGNAIDFYTKVRGLSFPREATLPRPTRLTWHDAMKELTGG
jgi:hypothetical protein